jgi:hypothetical protein
MLWFEFNAEITGNSTTGNRSRQAPGGCAEMISYHPGPACGVWSHEA